MARLREVATDYQTRFQAGRDAEVARIGGNAKVATVIIRLRDRHPHRRRRDSKEVPFPPAAPRLEWVETQRLRSCRYGCP
jgi:hypothetical protein